MSSSSSTNYAGSHDGAYAELSAKYEALQRRHDEAVRILKIVSKILGAHRSIWDRARAMQVAAAIARRGGPSGQNVIRDIEAQHPVAHDIGDFVDELVAAVGEKLPGVLR